MKPTHKKHKYVHTHLSYRSCVCRLRCASFWRICTLSVIALKMYRGGLRTRRRLCGGGVSTVPTAQMIYVQMYKHKHSAIGSPHLAVPRSTAVCIKYLHFHGEWSTRRTHARMCALSKAGEQNAHTNVLHLREALRFGLRNH